MRHTGNPARFKDFISASVQAAKLDSAALVRAFRASVDHHLEDPIRLIERTATEGNLDQDQLKAILASFANDGSEATLFGVVNAVTNAAQQEPAVESRVQMERLGTNLLGMVR